mmetsp:Transcript_19096/g.62233  ORF Transcript_19096/g.62233 Transcript_19096/m.62233 type:complete len:176 (-) Transcript_19096:238-765(-)
MIVRLMIVGGSFAGAGAAAGFGVGTAAGSTGATAGAAPATAVAVPAAPAAAIAEAGGRADIVAANGLGLAAGAVGAVPPMVPEGEACKAEAGGLALMVFSKGFAAVGAEPAILPAGEGLFTDEEAPLDVLPPMLLACASATGATTIAKAATNESTVLRKRSSEKPSDWDRSPTSP